MRLSELRELKQAYIRVSSKRRNMMRYDFNKLSKDEQWELRKIDDNWTGLQVQITNAVINCEEI